jgi:hypothetical protein
MLSRIAGRGKLGHGRAHRNCIMVERAALTDQVVEYEVASSESAQVRNFPY